MIKLGLLSTILVLSATGAAAQDVCKGPAPSAGTVIHGPVLDVPDGGSLCLATGAAPEAWVRVSVFRAPAGRSGLMAAAFGKNATCAVGKDGQAACMVEGEPLEQSLRRPEIVKAALEWR